MANLLASYINRADAATLSGGSWQASLPLAYLQQTNLGLVARSTNALVASTQFDIDLGSAEIIVRIFGLMRHNCSIAAQFKVSGGTTVGGSDVFSMDWADVWPRVYSYTDLDFEDPNWWTGQITDEEAALYPAKFLLDLGANYMARYWRLEISDTANADGYVEFARLWLGPAWQPATNYAYGAVLNWEPRDRANVSRSGKRYSERHDPARVFQLRLDTLTDAEAYGRLLDMLRRLGSEGQCVVIPDPDDLPQRHRRDILARIRRSGGVTATSLGYQSATLELEEWL